MELMDAIEWNEILSDDPDSFWLTWKNQLMEICVPCATIKQKRNVPWMNLQIKPAIRKRDKCSVLLSVPITDLNTGLGTSIKGIM